MNSNSSPQPPSGMPLTMAGAPSHSTTTTPHLSKAPMSHTLEEGTNVITE